MFIGNNIMFYRKTKRMTQADLAEAAELSPGFISQVETGRKEIGRRGLVRVAKALDIPIKLLLQEDEQGSEMSNDKLCVEKELLDCDGLELRIIKDLVYQVKYTLRTYGK